MVGERKKEVTEQHQGSINRQNMFHPSINDERSLNDFVCFLVADRFCLSFYMLLPRESVASNVAGSKMTEWP